MNEFMDQKGNSNSNSFILIKRITCNKTSQCTEQW